MSTYAAGHSTQPETVAPKPASQTDAYKQYLLYAAQVAALWTAQTGVTKTVNDVMVAGGAYAFDPSLDAGAYRNITAAVADEVIGVRTGVNPGITPGGGTATASQPPPTASVPAVHARVYGTVDNGVSTLSEYGFGQNRYTQGAPSDGYSYGNGTASTPGTPTASTSWVPPQLAKDPHYQAATSGATSATKTTTGNGTAASGLSTTQRNAWAYLQGILDQYGLGSLSQFVISELTAGRSQDEIALDLQQTPEFKTAFPEIAARKAAGLPPISPGEIVSYRNNAIQMMRAAGLPPGFYDSPSDVAQLIGNDVSLNELNDRIQTAKDATYNIDPAMQARLWQEFGLAPGSGNLAAYFLDHQRALPILQRQLQAAKIGGTADEVGYKGLNNATALDLAQAGVSADQARQGFATLGHEGELFGSLPGENTQDIGQGAQLAATFLGNTSATDRIERRRRNRLGVFADGGGYAAGQGGMSGLGSADQK